MSASESKPTRDEMLHRVRTGHAALESALDAIPADARATPGPDGWSVNDHLVHVAAWEQSLLALLRGLPRHEALGLDRETYDALDTDGINALVHAAYHERPAGEVRALFDESHRELLGELERMTDGDILKPYSAYQPDDPPENLNPVIDWIAGNTWKHYEEHTEVLQKLAPGS